MGGNRLRPVPEVEEGSNGIGGSAPDQLEDDGPILVRDQARRPILEIA